MTELLKFSTDKLINNFGSEKIDQKLLNRIVDLCKLKSINDLHVFFTKRNCI